MDREAVRRKIKNLLALAESDNENEALAAVQAARKLMMKYHISVEEEKGKEGIQKNIAVKELRFKRMPMKWHHLMLAWILAKNFRCRTFCRPKPVICTCFLGFEEDAHAALMLMEYLVRFMEQGAAAYRGSKSQEYGWRDGFCVGVDDTFKEQDREEPGYEIMAAVPREVNEAFETLKLMKKSGSRPTDHMALDGAAFSSGKISGRRAVDGRSIPFYGRREIDNKE